MECILIYGVLLLNLLSFQISNLIRTVYQRDVWMERKLSLIIQYNTDPLFVFYVLWNVDMEEISKTFQVQF